jgi:hypothetical protein
MKRAHFFSGMAAFRATRQFVVLAGLAALLVAVAGSRASGEPAQKIDVSTIPATVVDNVIIPVPSEVFGVLDKLGSPNWQSVLRPTASKPLGERPQVALLLGTVIAEGFIAVEAEDAEAVKEIGRSVLSLASAIGVRKSVTARSNAIIETADARDWQRVRVELDGALHDVREAMMELKDEQLAHLVSLGGWLRGTEALTEIVTKNYSADSAELLHQPTLLTFFERRLSEMDARMKNHELVAKIERKLPELRVLIGNGAAGIPTESVRQINTIASDLVKSVSSKPS